MPQSTSRKTDRLEAFSDAVLAIAFTLPIVELKPPPYRPDADLGRAYADLAAHYGAYLLGFAVIGLYWAHSHFSGKITRKTDHGFNLLTLLFLASVSLTPFPARPFLEHWGDEAGARTAALVYGGVLTLPAILWLSRAVYAQWRGLLDPRLAPDYLRALRRKYLLTAAACVAGELLVALVDWRVGMAVIAATILGYLAPPMAPRYKPGEGPGDELEEADEQ